jgi:hypothetical protein
MSESKLKALKLLDRISEGGKMYQKLVQLSVLQEKNWIRWKLESCPSFEQPSVDISQGVPKRKPDVFVFFSFVCLDISL